MDEHVGTLMREARQKMGLKQSDLAKKLEVQGSTISQWESAKATPSIDSFIDYCNACDAEPGALLTKVYGDPSKRLTSFKCTADEAEMIRRYRMIDERGQRAVRRTLNAEYEYALASSVEHTSIAGGTG